MLKSTWLVLLYYFLILDFDKNQLKNCIRLKLIYFITSSWTNKFQFELNSAYVAHIHLYLFVSPQLAVKKICFFFWRFDKWFKFHKIEHKHFNISENKCNIWKSSYSITYLLRRRFLQLSTAVYFNTFI